jgi:hypothetical protein
MCNGVRNLHKELVAGNQSFYAPYINYLLDTQPYGSLPAVWSEAGKSLFEEMLRGRNGIPIPPRKATSFYYTGHCKPEKRPDELYAYQLHGQRSWDDIIIPVYDILSHGNGRLLNTDVDEIFNTGDIRVRTNRDIQPGEELFCSYNNYPGDEDLAQKYGTPEIFRDFGFIERYPQRWIFDRKKSLSFELDQDESGAFLVKWLDDEPSDYAMEQLENMLEYLEEFTAEKLTTRNETVPDREWAAIKEYSAALNIALHAAIDANEERIDSCIISMNGCPENWFDDLAEDIQPLEVSGNLVRTCSALPYESMGSYIPFDSTTSLYGILTAAYNEETEDLCVSAYGSLKCSSFSPIRDEMFVHYPARYVDEVKRVAWIGGRDSTLLDEILKYPSLELALGTFEWNAVVRSSYPVSHAAPRS